MNDHERRSSRTTLSRLHEINRRRAREKARRIPDKLAEWIDRGIEWQAFVLWARAIVEAEGTIPQQVRSTLQQRCPGCESDVGVETEPEFWLRLRRWIDHNVFRKPTDEGCGRVPCFPRFAVGTGLALLGILRRALAEESSSFLPHARRMVPPGPGLAVSSATGQTSCLG